MYKKKSLGQHFLHAPSYLQKIVDAAKIKPGEHVLEVGPGDGALTEVLLAAGAHVVAIEKDHRLIEILKEKFKGRAFEVLEADVLEYDVTKNFQNGTYKIVANIPYYITGAFLKKFLSEAVNPSSMTLLIQKEVAERIARNKKESILSLSVKAYGTPRYIHTVPRGAFTPPPNVDSAILIVENISRERFISLEHEKKFFDLVHAGFAHKRKFLVRNLEAALSKEAFTCLPKANIALTARAEDVPLERWLELSRI